ncbi:MAG: hypothetical protein RR324_02420 [Cellulosilyticaceae bacterium]
MSYEYRDCCNPCCEHGRPQPSYEPKPVNGCCGTTGIYETLIALQQSIKEFNIPGFGVSVILTTVTGQSYTILFSEGIQNPPKVKPGTLTAGDLVISLCDVAKIKIQVSQNTNPRFKQVLSRRLKEVTTQFCNWDDYGYEEVCREEGCTECVREMQNAISRSRNPVDALSYNGSQEQISAVNSITHIDYEYVVGDVGITTQSNTFLTGATLNENVIPVVNEVDTNVVTAINAVNVVTNTVVTGVAPTTAVVSGPVSVAPTAVVGSVGVVTPGTGIVTAVAATPINVVGSVATVAGTAVGSIATVPVALVSAVNSTPVGVLGDITPTSNNVVGSLTTVPVTAIGNVATTPVTLVGSVTTTNVGVVGSLVTLPTSVIQSVTTTPVNVVGSVATTPTAVITAINPTIAPGALTGINGFAVNAVPVATVTLVNATQVGDLYVTIGGVQYPVHVGSIANPSTVSIGPSISVAQLGAPANFLQITGPTAPIALNTVVTGFNAPTTANVVGSVSTVTATPIASIVPIPVNVVGTIVTVPTGVVGSVATVAGTAVNSVTTVPVTAIGGVATVPTSVVTTITKVPATAVGSIVTVPGTALSAVTTTPVGMVAALNITNATPVNSINVTTVAGGVVTSVIPGVINNVVGTPGTAVVLNGINTSTISVGNVTGTGSVAFNAVTNVLTTLVVNRVGISTTTLPALTLAVPVTLPEAVIADISTTAVPVLSPVVEDLDGQVDSVGNGVVVVENTNGDLTVYSVCEITSVNG